MATRAVLTDWVDWEVCRRVLNNQEAGRRLTLTERATVYRAVIAGGGTPNNAAGLMHLGTKYFREVVEFVAATGGVVGPPVVDGVTLKWDDRYVKKVNRWY